MPDTEKQMRAVFTKLNEDGAREFADEIISATFAIRDQGDLRPLTDTIEAWYRTLLFVEEDPKGRLLEALSRDHSEGRGYTLEEIEVRRRRRPA
ncbi:MAG: hypothetical protein ACRDIW_01300 [Actinomycetota bacterium]